MEATVNFFHRVLSFAGISIFAKKHWDSKAWMVLHIVSSIGGMLSFLFESVFIFFKTSNLLMFIEAACIWNTQFITFVMLGMYFLFKKEFRIFLEEAVFKDFILEIPLIENVLNFKYNHAKLTELKELVVNSQENLYKYTLILLKCYLSSVCICVTLYLCGPIFSMIMTEDKNLRLLAFDMWFPWGLENFKVYIASFVFNMYTGYICCVVYSGLQSTIVYLISQIVRQLRILTFILQHLDVLASELVEDRKEEWQSVCTDLLTQCLIHYVKIKRFSNRLTSICRPFYLALLLVAVLLFCLCSVKIAISDKLSIDTAKYYVHVYCYIIMVFMFCMMGQLVINECDKLEMTLTEKWYIYDARHKRHMIIFKMALYQNMPIYIFGTVTLSLPTFTWALRTGMSVFTLLMSFL